MYFKPATSDSMHAAGSYQTSILRSMWYVCMQSQDLASGLVERQKSQTSRPPSKRYGVCPPPWTCLIWQSFVPIPALPTHQDAEVLHHLLRQPQTENNPEAPSHGGPHLHPSSPILTCLYTPLPLYPNGRSASCAPQAHWPCSTYPAITLPLGQNPPWEGPSRAQNPGPFSVRRAKL